VTLTGQGFAAGMNVFVGDGRAAMKVLDANTARIKTPPGNGAARHRFPAGGAAASLISTALRKMGRGRKPRSRYPSTWPGGAASPMSTATLTLALPEALYHRLERTALATKQPLEDVALHALNLGSPPAWDDVPAEFQLDLAALDKMDDEALWKIAKSRMTADYPRRDELLDRNAEGRLSPAERVELDRLRHEEDVFMLRKAHAAALLRWRGHTVPSP
jgi:hypothetical protein